MIEGIVIGFGLASTVFVVRELVRVRSERIEKLEQGATVFLGGHGKVVAILKDHAAKLEVVESKLHALDRDAETFANKTGAKRYEGKRTT